jgi:hypothetical protein
MAHDLFVTKLATPPTPSRLRLKRDGTRAGTRFGL